MSIQFIPLTPNPNRDLSKNGYIWLTAKTLVDTDGTPTFQSRIYLFEAWDITKGPICILAGERFNFCTSLHVTWLEEVQEVQSGYKVNIEEDFNWSIENSFLEVFEVDHYKSFFEKYVYPNFK